MPTNRAGFRTARRFSSHLAGGREESAPRAGASLTAILNCPALWNPTPPLTNRSSKTAPPAGRPWM
jgi:hypothetical protein